MKKNTKLSLKFYIFLFLVVGNLFADVIFISILSSSNSQSNRKEAVYSIDFLLKQITGQITNYLEFNSKIIEATAKEIEDEKLPLDSSLTLRLATNNKKFTNFNSSFIADKNGVVVAAFSRLKPEQSEQYIGKNYSNENFYPVLIKERKTTFSEPTLGLMSKKPIITIAVPIFDNNEMIGFAGGNLSLDGIGEILRNSDAHNSKVIYTIDQNYHLIASSKNGPPWLGETGQNQDVDFSKYKIAQLSLSGKTEILDKIESPDNQKVIGGYTFLPKTNWGIFVSQPVSTLNFFQEQNYFLLILAVTSIFAFTFLMAFTLYFLVIRGIENLIADSQEVTNPGEQIPTFSESPVKEIQILSEQFRAMASRLQVTYDILKKRYTGEAQISEMKENFINIVSHELRTPMTITKGYLTMVFDSYSQKLPEDVKSFLQEIYASNNRLIKMVSNLLDLIEIESGKAEFVRKEIDLPSVINNILGIMKRNNNISDKKIKIIYRGGENIKNISSNEKWLNKLLTQLIDNALKFTGEGKIEIKHEIKDNQIVTSISDTGIGVSEENKKFLFQKLRQIDRERNEKAGIGIGLYLSRLIVENLGGKIWCESQLGHGSTFYFSLPME